jgi:spore coat protein U-like protein
VAAQSQAPKLLVQAIIGDACTVTAAALDFGAGFDGVNPIVATGSIDISCVAETTFDVVLDGGLHPTAVTEGGRQMAQGASQLLYILYTDQVDGNAWGTGEAREVTIDGAGSVPVIGKLPSQPNGHAPGLHTDEVLITLNFE